MEGDDLISNDKDSRLRTFRFGFRTLFLLVTVFGVGAGWLRLHFQRAEHQRIAVEALMYRYNAGINYQGLWYRSLPFRLWNHFGTVDRVELECWGNVGLRPIVTKADIPDICQHIHSLTQVEEILLDGEGMCDEVADEFKRRLSQLEVKVQFHATRNGTATWVGM